MYCRGLASLGPCNGRVRKTSGQSIALLSGGKTFKNYLKRGDAWLPFLSPEVSVQQLQYLLNASDKPGTMPGSRGQW